MRVFVSGATGLVGSRLIRLLLDAGHEVSAHTRDHDAALALQDDGVKAAVADVFDAEMLRAALGVAEPEVVMHQLTALPDRFDRERAAEQYAENNRVRTEGTRNLVEAAEVVGARRVIAQSLAFAYEPTGDWIKDEDAPLFLDAPAPWGAGVAAIAELERQVLEFGDSIVLRYGHLYGPSTYFDPDGGQIADRVRAGKLPLVGDAAGVFSFTHVDDAAAAALAALEAPEGIYNAVDDEPLRARDWLPEFASELDGPAPETVTEGEGLERLGWTWTHRLTEQRGASNARAGERFGWRPSHARWGE